MTVNSKVVQHMDSSVAMKDTGVHVACCHGLTALT